MSLYAVESYVASDAVLAGLVSPLLPPLEAWVLPPQEVDLAEGPKAYVWGGTLDEQRATLPRPLLMGEAAGQKRTVYTISCYIQWAGQPDDGASFPLLLDAIRARMRIVRIGVPIVDSVTGEQTVLSDFGERIRVDHGRPVSMASESGAGMLQHVAVVRLDCAEWLGGA
jgi:hypothetical protein